MSAKRRIEAAIFDMDGLLIDSEPLWDQAEVEVMESLGVDTRRRDELPDLLGLRIDLVVDLWYAQQPWHGVDRAELPRALFVAPLSWWKPHARCCRAYARQWPCVKLRA